MVHHAQVGSNRKGCVLMVVAQLNEVNQGRFKTIGWVLSDLSEAAPETETAAVNEVAPEAPAQVD